MEQRQYSTGQDFIDFGLRQLSQLRHVNTQQRILISQHNRSFGAVYAERNATVLDNNMLQHELEVLNGIITELTERLATAARENSSLQALIRTLRDELQRERESRLI